MERTVLIIEDEKLMDLAALQRGMLDEIAAARPISAVRGIRGRGAMLAIQVGECGEDLAAPLGAKLAQRGVLVTTPGGHSVRLLLPYRAGKEELSEIWEALGDALATS